MSLFIDISSFSMVVGEEHKNYTCSNLSCFENPIDIEQIKEKIDPRSTPAEPHNDSS